MGCQSDGLSAALRIFRGSVNIGHCHENGYGSGQENCAGQSNSGDCLLNDIHHHKEATRAMQLYQRSSDGKMSSCYHDYGGYRETAFVVCQGAVRATES